MKAKKAAKKYDKNLKKIAKIGKYDVWNLDIELAHFLMPRLKKILKTKNGIPWSIVFPNKIVDVPLSTTKKEFNNYKKQWKRMVKKIIKSLELIISDDISSIAIEKENEKIIEQGLILLAKNLRGMWT